MRICIETTRGIQPTSPPCGFVLLSTSQRPYCIVLTASNLLSLVLTGTCKFRNILSAAMFLFDSKAGLQNQHLQPSLQHGAATINTIEHQLLFPQSPLPEAARSLRQRRLATLNISIIYVLSIEC